MKTILIAIIAFVLACTTTTGNRFTPLVKTTSTESATSECKGSIPQVNTAVLFTNDTTSFCSAEKLPWNYSSSDTILRIYHSRCIRNCACRYVIGAAYSGDTVTISEQDTNHFGQADCICTFNLYTEIPVPAEPSLVTLAYDGNNWPVNLLEGNGCIIVDSTRS